MYHYYFKILYKIKCNFNDKPRNNVSTIEESSATTFTEAFCRI